LAEGGEGGLKQESQCFSLVFFGATSCCSSQTGNDLYEDFSQVWLQTKYENNFSKKKKKHTSIFLASFLNHV
jgi:hypothetical protein